ncbi:MAG: hypothetical protein NCW75_14375 [Phycisphaera sp.]|nr:MAG: hypothetical protein NCW75_14375 [Phycisphaera sp.]
MASQTNTQTSPQSVETTEPRPAVFKMSALHPRAGKASAAGTAPNLLSEMAGLFEGSLTSGLGPSVGMLPQPKPAPQPKAEPPRPAQRRKARVAAESKPKPNPKRMTAEEARAFLLGANAPAGQSAQARLMRTPPIPQHIRDVRAPGFTSVYEILPEEPRLFALESVYGRWDGKVLVLDSAPTHVQVVKARLQRNTLRPYCQNETSATYGLARLAFPLASRGVLAGTAFGPLLINSNERDELAAHRDQVRKIVAPTLRFVIKNMPNLKAIVCLGVTAYEFVLHAMTSKVTNPDTLARYPEDFDSTEPVRPIFGGPTVFLTCRTSPEAIRRRGGETRAIQDWQAVTDHLTQQERPRALRQLGRGKAVRDIQAA